MFGKSEAQLFFLFLQLPLTPPLTLTHPCDYPSLPSLPIQILPQSNWRYVWAKGVGEVVGRVTGGGVGGGWYSYSTRVG